MNGWEKPISKLHVMLKTVEKNIPKKASNTLMIRERRSKKPKHQNSKEKREKYQGELASMLLKSLHQRGRKMFPKMMNALSVESLGIRRGFQM